MSSSLFEILAAAEGVVLFVLFLRWHFVKRGQVHRLIEENRRRIALLETQRQTAGDSVESMLEENAQLRHRLAVEQFKFKFVQDENNELRKELYDCQSSQTRTEAREA